MKVETHYVKDDPEAVVIYESVDVILDGTPQIVEALKILIDAHMNQEGWEKR